MKRSTIGGAACGLTLLAAPAFAQLNGSSLFVTATFPIPSVKAHAGSQP